jgi:hypothetical protein
VPIIELPTISYDDFDKDPHRMVDKLNDAMRQLDWLLNRGRLDAQNINQTVIQIQPADPEKPQPVDPYGLNPEYFKYYPNKCWNSSFEVFDPATFKPKYWDTAGVVSPDANFDSTYSLKLAPGQYAQQAEADGEGLADPGWWPWCSETRISFRVKGAGGKVRVQVIQGGVAVPLWIWVKDAKGNWVKSKPAPEIVFDAAPDWPVALRTFAAQTSPAGGRMALRFENTGTADVYIDAVTIEPDWTGRWPSFYTHGPKSGGVFALGDEYLEYGSADWSTAGAEFILVNAYEQEPLVVASVQGDPNAFAGAGFVLITSCVQEIVQSRLLYSRVRVIPKGTLPNTQAAKIVMYALCKGKVSRS